MSELAFRNPRDRSFLFLLMPLAVASLPSLLFCVLEIALALHGKRNGSLIVFHLPPRTAWDRLLALQSSVYGWVARWNTSATLAATGLFVATLLLPMAALDGARSDTLRTAALRRFHAPPACRTAAMTTSVKIVECPRDSWQGLPKIIPAEVKADYLRTLIAAGFTHLDAASFVSPKAVPQMADSEQVLSYLDSPTDVEVIGIVVNPKGAARAIETEAVSTLGFPYSISPEFLQRNQNQSPEETLEALDAVGTAAFQAGLGMVAYISMAFGNPYGDPWSVDEVVAACDLLVDLGHDTDFLADTVGLAGPAQVTELVQAVLNAVDPAIEVGVHLHARPSEAAEKIAAAYRVGCRRFDMAIGGLGGCPFAQDTLIGNIPTEIALAELGGWERPCRGCSRWRLAGSRWLRSSGSSGRRCSSSACLARSERSDRLSSRISVVRA